MGTKIGTMLQECCVNQLLVLVVVDLMNGRFWLTNVSDTQSDISAITIQGSYSKSTTVLISFLLEKNFLLSKPLAEA